VKSLKKYIGLIPVALFAILLGCGGGGGGGGGSSSNSNGSTTGFTSGQTNAQAGDTILGQLVRGSDKVVGATVRFFDNGNNLLGTTVTNTDGYFRAALGTNATKVDVDGTTLGGSQVGFKYGLSIYQASTSSPNFQCKVALPVITPGVLTPMPDGQFMFNPDNFPPLPPPTGCVP
jgi:hypothetical protein